MTSGDAPVPAPEAGIPAPGRLARAARLVAVPAGIVDLVSGSMLLALASGLGLVAPPLLGGFATALAVGAAGAVTLGLARALLSAGLRISILVTVARISGLIGHLLVLLSQTGVAVIVVAAVISLTLTVVLLVALWLGVVQTRGS